MVIYNNFNVSAVNMTYMLNRHFNDMHWRNFKFSRILFKKRKIYPVRTFISHYIVFDFVQS